MTTRPPARSARTTAAGALALALLLTGCGTQAQDRAPAADPAPASEPTPGTESAEPDGPTGSTEARGTVVEVTIAGGEIEPKGERVRVAVGEPVTFVITSEVPGEVHVHATPETEFSFDRGTSRHQVTVRTPGLVDVELHDPAVTLVQLEAR